MSQATALLADAESSISAGAWDQALEQLENIKQSEPQEPDVYKKLAHVQAVRGKFRSVVATYVELIGVLVGAGQLPEAEKAIHKVLSLNPECIEAREKRIEIEKHRGHTERAVYLARELARLCIEQGDGDRSVCFRKPRKISRRIWIFLLSWLRCLFRTGRFRTGPTNIARLRMRFRKPAT